MDFLDSNIDFGTHQGEWVGFLGLGNNKQKASAQNTYEADIQARYPFSDNCDEQKKLIAAMLEESRNTLVARNSAKKSSRSRNDLTGKLRAFDQYIPAAQDYLKNTSCVASTTPAGTTGTSGTPGTSAAATNGTVAASSNAAKYAMIGFGILILVGAGIFIYKKAKN